MDDHLPWCSVVKQIIYKCEGLHLIKVAQCTMECGQLQYTARPKWRWSSQRVFTISSSWYFSSALMNNIARSWDELHFCSNEEENVYYAKLVLKRLRKNSNSTFYKKCDVPKPLTSCSTNLAGFNGICIDPGRIWVVINKENRCEGHYTLLVS